MVKELIKPIEEAAKIMIKAYENKNKILICGNGGSAADSQHLAAEFVSRFLKERKALPALALNTNSSTVTAIGNDYGYDYVFSRQVEAFGVPGDVLWAISTSGNSKNVFKAVESARNNKIKVISMTGQSGGALKGLSDILLNVPSDHTPRIQECHILIGHIICELVENALFA